MRSLYNKLNECLDTRSKLQEIADVSSSPESIDVFNYEFDEDQANVDRLAAEETEVIEKPAQKIIDMELPAGVEMMTIADIIEGLSDNASEETIDAQFKLFKKIASILKVRNYDEIIVATNDIEYDPKYLMQDGYPVQYKDSNLTYYPSENIVVEVLNGNMYLYFVTEKACKRYFALASKFLQDYDLDEKFVEDTAEPERIEIPRVDDEFKWSL